MIVCIYACLKLDFFEQRIHQFTNYYFAHCPFHSHYCQPNSDIKLILLLQQPNGPFYPWPPDSTSWSITCMRTPLFTNLPRSLLCTKVQSLCPSTKHQGNLVLANCPSFCFSPMHQLYWTTLLRDSKYTWIFRSGYNSPGLEDYFFSFLFSNGQANSISSTASLLINPVRRIVGISLVVEWSRIHLPGASWWVQGLRVCLPMQETPVPSPDRGRSHLLQGS